MDACGPSTQGLPCRGRSASRLRSGRCPARFLVPVESETLLAALPAWRLLVVLVSGGRPNPDLAVGACPPVARLRPLLSLQRTLRSRWRLDRAAGARTPLRTSTCGRGPAAALPGCGS
eukprot:scaffold620_cov386-Prasinococcus_capsulatus_cf.AAC.13